MRPSSCPAALRSAAACLSATLLVSAGTATAQVAVSVLPGYPNAPTLTPAERVLARDGVSLRLWGNVERGESAPAGATYEWYIAPNGNVSVGSDGDLTGPVTDPDDVREDVVLTLLNGSTREILTATLIVTDPADPTGGGQRTVEILLLGDDDPDVDTPLEELEIDARLAIQRALWFIYDRQELFGDWHIPSRQNLASTSFVLWALQNRGHSDRNDRDEDIFARPIARGYDYMFANFGEEFTDPADLTAGRATVALGATADGISDMNGNGRTIRISLDNDNGYYHPIALAAVVSSNRPDSVVRTGPLAGLTFREVVEDGIDYLGANQNEGRDVNWGGTSVSFDGRGGWTYEPRSDRNRSDMSINGWAYVAMEGAKDVFGIDTPDWMKREIEYSLLGHMRGQVGDFPYGYTGAPAEGSNNNMARTGAGLTGLTVVLTRPGAGDVLAQYTDYGLTDFAQQRENAIRYLGSDDWSRAGAASLGGGNRGNYYVMWSVARGLRATAQSLGLPEGEKVLLPFNGELIDWETGASPGSNEVPLDDREGYWSYLRRNQFTDPTDGRYGGFDRNHQLGDSIEAAVGVLILTRNVFVDPCPSLVQIEVDEVSPAPATSFEAGVPFTFTGRAVQEAFDRPVTDVFVDGRAVDSLDATGRFFTSILLDEGPNEIEIEAFDPCGSTVTTVTLQGTTVGGGFEQYDDVTPYLDLVFTNTTFNQASGWLVVDAEACSSFDAPLSGPILLALDATSSAAVQAVNADGVLPDGRPYFLFVNGAIEGTLPAGGCTSPRQLIFSNPSLTPFDLQSTWLAPENGVPVFTSTPPARAYTAGGLVYDAGAVDPEGAPVAFALLSGPEGMAVDAGSGLVTWTPTAADVGTHQIVLEASDGTVGTARQSWSLEVVDGDANRPPVFVSAPLVQASVGAQYAYAAEAVDADLDAVTYSLDEAPAGVAVDDVTGAVTWDFALGGLHPIVVRATDPGGAYALQGYTLAVGSIAMNPHAPTIDGTPPLVAAAGVPYRYQPIANDPDEGDVLTFRLDEAPLGMSVDGDSGLVQWLPGTAQVGAQNVVLRVEDGLGGFGVQAWSIDVSVGAGDLPPSIVSLPPRVALVGAPYAYTLEAYDPEGTSLEYELAVGPAGLTVDPASGVATWVPAAAGVFDVGLRVRDAGGLTGTQAFQVDVAAFNGAPDIVSMPPSEATEGAPFYYDVNAIDPDGHAVTYALSAGPGGVAIDAATGLIRWEPTLADVGVHSFNVVATDVFGAPANQFFDVTVSEDVTPPTVTITTSPASANIGEPVTICVQAGDDVGVTARTLSIDGAPETLDSAGCATVVFGALGTVDLVATASDAAGQIATEARALQVVDPNDVQHPEIEILFPAPGALLRGPIDVVASVTDNTPTSLLWRVEYRRDGAGDWTEIASGAGEVSAEPLARFDTTILPNGRYELRIVGEDGVTAPWAVPFPVDVVGSYKLGDYETRTIDLSMPLAGFPIALERRYSTLDAEGGDFGPGWSLAFAGGIRDTKPDVGGNIEKAYDGATRVYVTLPSGTVQVFRFTAIGGLFFLQVAGFEAEAGSVGTLRPALPADEFCVNSGGLFFTPFEGYNVDEFLYTDPEGNDYYFTEGVGLTRIVDAFGETIDISTNAVVSSRGPSITFERDAAGRITRATGPDPDGDPASGAGAPVVEYRYDAEGRLEAAGAAGLPKVSYLYEDPNFPLYLTTIVDQNGTPAVRMKFDDEGRLVAQCGPEGDLVTCEGCIAFDTDSAADFQSVTTATGGRIDFFFSDTGDLVTERRWLDATEYVETAFTYDADGRMLSETLQGVTTTTWNYDDQGRMTGFTPPAGLPWQIVQAECGASTLIRPNGDAETLGYDDDCRVIGMTNSLGETRSIGYTDDGRFASWTNPEGGTLGMTFSDEGTVIGFRDAENAAETLAVLDDDNFDFRVDRAGRRRDFTFDDLGRVIEERWDDGTVITFRYNAAGSLERMANAESILEFTYWPDGLMKEQRLTYLADGTVERLVYGTGDMDAPLRGYDLSNHLSSVMDSHGGQALYTYDALGRMTSARWPGAAPTGSAVSSVTGGSAVAGSATEVTGSAAVGGVAGSAAGSGGSIDVPPAALVEFDRSSPSHPDTHVIHEVRRIAGQPGDAPAVTTSFGYAFQGDGTTLSAIEHVLASSGTPIASYGYTQDANGFPVAWTDTEGAHTAVLDGAGRLLSVDHPAGAGPDEAYGYDGNGNRIASHLDGNLVHSIDDGSGSDRLLSSDAFELTHDAVGSVTRLVERGPGGATYDFTYDPLRRVRSITRSVGGTVDRVVERDYDPLGRLIEERVDGVVRRFVNDATNAILMTDGAGNVLERRLCLRNYDSVQAVARGTELLWPLVDHVGTVRDWAAADGTALAHHVFDAFGNPVGPIDPALPALGFQSRDRIADFPLYDFRARVYDPRQGRFLGEDVQRPWSYAFAENNPLFYGDPTGECAAIQYACMAGASASWGITIGNIAGGTFRISMEASTLGLQGPQFSSQAVGKAREAVQYFLTGITIDVAITAFAPDLPCAVSILDMTGEVAAAWGHGDGGLWSRLFGNDLKDRVGPGLMMAAGL